MALEDRKLWGETHVAQPTTNYTDGTPNPLRASRRGELAVMSMHGGKLSALADEGAYFTATNPTPGTGVAGIAAADGYDATEALIFLRNGAAAGGKNVHLDFIRLIPTAAGTNGTDFACAMVIDKGNTRYTSGGSAIAAKNTNMASDTAANLAGYFGAVVTAAASSDARLIMHKPLRPAIKVIGDEYLFTFGGSDPNVGSLQVSGTAITKVVTACPPVVLGPEQMFLLHEFSASQTVAASYQWQVGWYER